MAYLKKLWQISMSNFSQANVALLNALLLGFRNSARAFGKKDVFVLFQILKRLQDLLKDKVEKRFNRSTGQAETYRTALDFDDGVLLYGLYAIACVELAVAGQVNKRFARNRNGLTKEEIEYFYKPVDRNNFAYRSNVRKFIGPPSYRSDERQFSPDLRLGEVQSFLGTYALTRNQLAGLDLVNLEKTMEIQHKWEEVRTLTDLIALASRNNDVKRLVEIFSDGKHDTAIGYLIKFILKSAPSSRKSFSPINTTSTTSFTAR